MSATGGQGRLRVAVLGGGTSSEHEVSLASAAAVADALAPRHDAVRLTLGRDGTWREGPGRPIGLAGAVHALRSCDVAVPVLHGPGGEDGTAAALCDLAGVPYAGSGVRAGALAMDKWATRLVAADLGIAVAAGTLLTAATAPSYAFTHPVVVKPAASGSSHGVSLVTAAGQLPAAVAGALALDDRVLVEDVLVGPEVSIAVLGRPDGSRRVPPALESRVDGLMDATRKYDGSVGSVVPAEVAPDDLSLMRVGALALFDALGCSGAARVDFFVTRRGPVLGEVNTAPGFTAGSTVPTMFAADGLPYPELLETLVRDALAVGARRA